MPIGINSMNSINTKLAQITELTELLKKAILPERQKKTLILKRIKIEFSNISKMIDFDLQRGWSRSRTLSVSYVAGTASPLEQRGSTTQV